ncbi:MAG: hypothetical protein DMG01_03670 [Acidobacteria bacterium]|nr:MAG: hypothetical protein DMG01_03670 [Acidobacteriota bacterium]
MSVRVRELVFVRHPRSEAEPPILANNTSCADRDCRIASLRLERAAGRASICCDRVERSPMRQITRSTGITWRTIADNVGAAIVTIPNRQAWRRCALVYALFLVCSLPIGLLSGLLHPGLAPLAPAAAILTTITLLAHPACTEELIFRVMMLPRRIDRLPRGSLCALAIALIAFVAAHPLNARLFWPASLGLFANPYYLALAALLGLACSAAYLISGSIWPSILIHWISVVLWMLLLGGQALLDSYR